MGRSLMASQPEFKYLTRIKSNERYKEFKAVIPANELTSKWRAFVEKAGSLRLQKYHLQREKAKLIFLPTKAARQARGKIAVEIAKKEEALRLLFESKKNITKLNFHKSSEINRRIDVGLTNSPKLASLTVFKNKLILDNNRTPAFRHGVFLWDFNETAKIRLGNELRKSNPTARGILKS
ncbi:MAG: hypothetical protein AABY04_00715 [Candidatus Micrarchaeota archaeon]